MKNTFIPILFLFFSQFSSAQTNLVPNPSFEDTVDCPVSAGQVDKALYWFPCRNTPEYYNYCNNALGGYVGVPTNWCGYQYPHSGDAYAGMIPYDVTSAPWREYIGVQLLAPTIVGQKYFATMWVSWLGVPGMEIAINKLGFALSSIQYSTTNPYQITNNPNAFSDSIFTDSVGWGKIRLSFIADSAYQYIMLGNFFDDSNTDTIHLGLYNQHAYYYLDDVCLSTDSLICEFSTENTNENHLVTGSIIENCFLSNGNIHIDFNHSKAEKSIFLFSTIGELLYSDITKQDYYEIPYTKTNAMYFIKLISNNKQESKKIITIKN